MTKSKIVSKTPHLSESVLKVAREKKKRAKRKVKPHPWRKDRFKEMAESDQSIVGYGDN